MDCVTIIITKYTVNKRRILWMQYYESDTLEKSECGAFKWYGNNKHKSCAVHGACDCCELIKVVFIGSINVVAPSTRPCWQAWSAVRRRRRARAGPRSQITKLTAHDTLLHMPNDPCRIVLRPLPAPPRSSAAYILNKKVFLQFSLVDTKAKNIPRCLGNVKIPTFYLFIYTHYPYITKVTLFFL